MINSKFNLFQGFNELYYQTKKWIKEYYLTTENDFEWIIPFSWGRDSKALLQMVIENLQELPFYERKRKITIVNIQTGIELPFLSLKVNQIFKSIQNLAFEQSLPIETLIINPKLDDSFWVNIIGRGFPIPRNQFQWCADKTKMPSVVDLIKEKTVDREIIVLSSDISKPNKIEVFEKHPYFPNAYLFSPIKNFEPLDSWTYLYQRHTTPWSESNFDISKFYEDVQNWTSTTHSLNIEEELKDKRGICGNIEFDLHFACWNCPYNRKHESFINFINNNQSILHPNIKNEEEKFIPLLKYRDFFYETMTNNENKLGRENKQKMSLKNNNDMKNFNQLQSETLLLEYREKLLEELFVIQLELQESFSKDIVLIQEEEVDYIKEIWKQEQKEVNEKLDIIESNIKNNVLLEEIQFVQAELFDVDSIPTPKAYVEKAQNSVSTESKSINNKENQQIELFELSYS